MRACKVWGLEDPQGAACALAGGSGVISGPALPIVWEELRLRPLYRDLLAAGIFQKFVFISLEGGRRVYTVRDGEVPP